MNWDDERWIKVYTRDTAEWNALSWQAQGLFLIILRKLDLAGVMSLGRLGPRGVAAAIHAPWSDIEPILAELLQDGCVQLRDECLFVPNFMAAQEAKRSDRARQRDARERRLTAAKEAPEVTRRDEMSHSVTPVNGFDEKPFTTVTKIRQTDRFVPEERRGEEKRQEERRVDANPPAHAGATHAHAREAPAEDHGDPDDWRAQAVPPGTPIWAPEEVVVQEQPPKADEATPKEPRAPMSAQVSEALTLLEARPPLARCATTFVAEQIAALHIASSKTFAVIAAGLDYAAEQALSHDVAQEPMPVPKLVNMVLRAVRTQRTEEREAHLGRNNRSRFSVPQQPYNEDDEWMAVLKEIK